MDQIPDLQLLHLSKEKKSKKRRDLDLSRAMVIMVKNQLIGIKHSDDLYVVYDGGVSKSGTLTRIGIFPMYPITKSDRGDCVAAG